jgi:transposase
MRKLKISNKLSLLSTCKEEATRNQESRFLHRLHCMLLVAQGCSCYQVAEWFGEHPCTIERWVHYFQEYGVEGLKDEQKSGRPGKIHNDQVKRLQGDISKNPFELGYNQHRWNGKLLKTHLEHRYNIELSVRQCQRLLHQSRNSAACSATLAQ